jgi:AcrR family transcriptional regulator
VDVVTRTSPPKQERSREKLERLLRAGRALFAEHGFEGTRISDVVERAGCSVGVFYARFDDKDSFFAAVQDHFLAELAEVTTDLNAHAAELGGVELLRATIAQGVGIFRGNAALVRAFLNHEATHPSAGQPIRTVVETRARQLVEAVLESGTPIGHPDPETAIAVGAHVIRGALLQEAIHGPGLLPLDDDALVDELTDLFTAYLRIPT